MQTNVMKLQIYKYDSFISPGSIEYRLLLQYYYYHRLQPFVRDYPGELVPEG